MTGCGIGPTYIQSVVGVAKAYTTRVGSGPFPTELEDAMGEALRNKGHEFGVTTGRPRRCGWLDAVVLKHSVRVSGITDLALTKLDVLDELKEIKICTSYRWQGETITEFPAALNVMNEVEPVYESLEGWCADTSGCRTYEELPKAAQAYIRRVEELVGAEVGIVAVGPDRKQTIMRKEF